MPVLIEAYSIVLLTEAITQHWPGGWQGFAQSVPNRQLCMDSEVARVGFMQYDDLRAFAVRLELHGIREANGEEEYGGYVVVGQLQGPKTDAVWLTCSRMESKHDTARAVLACSRIGSDVDWLAVPEGWQYDGSLSDKPMFSKPDSPEGELRFVRRQDGLDVYYNTRLRKLVYVGRTDGR